MNMQERKFYDEWLEKWLGTKVCCLSLTLIRKMQTVNWKNRYIYINIICCRRFYVNSSYKRVHLSATALLHFAICCVCCLYIHSLVHQLRSTQAARMTEGTSAFDMGWTTESVDHWEMKPPQKTRWIYTCNRIYFTNRLTKLRRKKADVKFAGSEYIYTFWNWKQGQALFNWKRQLLNWWLQECKNAASEYCHYVGYLKIWGHFRPVRDESVDEHHRNKWSKIIFLMWKK